MPDQQFFRVLVLVVQNITGKALYRGPEAVRRHDLVQPMGLEEFSSVVFEVPRPNTFPVPGVPSSRLISSLSGTVCGSLFFRPRCVAGIVHTFSTKSKSF